jgi:hypothetical protein
MNWTVEGRGDEFAIVDEMGVEVATVPYTDEMGAEPLDTAEGRRAVLLAAAPELLAALEELLMNLDDADATTDEDGEDFADIARARAAIARAKGGQ